MPVTKVKSWVKRQTVFSILRRILILLLVTIAFTAIFNRPSRPGHVAGFGRGIVDGALMPGALPPLLFGRDVTIYAPSNAGRPYKLGYTLGVNGCGALFFGFMFWRVSRWKKSRTQSIVPDQLG